MRKTFSFLLILSLVSPPSSAGIFKDIYKAAKKVGEGLGEIGKELGEIGKELGEIGKELGEVVVEALEGTVDIIDNTVDATGEVVKMVGNTGKATGYLLINDGDGFDRTLDKIETGAENLARDVGSALGNTAELGVDVAVNAPLRVSARALDVTFRTDGSLYRELVRTRNKSSRELNKASAKIGSVLRVATHPENLGKITLIYFAAMVGGPAGSALINVLYDKFVLGYEMDGDDILKGFAIGAAAGYAAQEIPYLVGGEATPDAAQYSDYLAKASSHVTQNLVTDLGGITLNSESYTSRDFFKSLAEGMAVIETGDSYLENVIESTLQGGLQETSIQAVENDLNFKKIDFDRVEIAIYEHMAQGITTESIHLVLEEIVPDNWKRLDRELWDELVAIYHQAITSNMENQVDKFWESLQNASPEDQERFLQGLMAKGQEIADQAAQGAFEKNYAQLTLAEQLSVEFATFHEKVVAESFQDREVDEYFHSITSSFYQEPVEGRSPDALLLLPFVVKHFLLGLSALATYEFSYKSTTLVLKYFEERKEGQSLEEFIQENRDTLNELGIDAALAVSGLTLAKISWARKLFKHLKYPRSSKKMAALLTYIQKHGHSMDEVDEVMGYAKKLNITTSKGLDNYIKAFMKGDIPSRVALIKGIIKRGYKKVPAHKLDNLLKNFTGQSYDVRGKTVLLDKNGLKHIWERHHPDYWDGSIRYNQSFLHHKPSVQQVEDIIGKMIEKNHDVILKRGFITAKEATKITKINQISVLKKETSATLMEIIDGQKYVLSVKDGRVRQFYRSN